MHAIKSALLLIMFFFHLVLVLVEQGHLYVLVHSFNTLEIMIGLTSLDFHVKWDNIGITWFRPKYDYKQRFIAYKLLLHFVLSSYRHNMCLFIKQWWRYVNHCQRFMGEKAYKASIQFMSMVINSLAVTCISTHIHAYELWWICRTSLIRTLWMK